MAKSIKRRSRGQQRKVKIVVPRKRVAGYVRLDGTRVKGYLRKRNKAERAKWIKSHKKPSASLAKKKPSAPRAKKKVSALAKGKRKKKPSATPRSLGEVIRKRFKGRKFRKIDEKRYRKGKSFRGTLHKIYEADPNINALTKFMSKSGDHAFNLILNYVDKNGVEQYRQTANTLKDSPSLLVSKFDKLLNKYQSANDIAVVLNVMLDVWDDEDAFA